MIIYGSVMQIIAGRNTQFIVLLVFSLAVLIGTWLGGTGRKFQLRPLPAVDALSEAVGRAAELGAPIHFNPGWYELNSVEAPQTVAALSILTKLAHEAAKSNVPIITTLIRPDSIPLIDDIMRTAYMSEGKPELYNPDNIRYLSGEQWAYIGGVAKIFRDERPAANICMGGFMAYSLLIMELATRFGMFRIGGTASWHQMPFFAATAHYILIGEELYAAGAYVSEDPYLIGSLSGQDVNKFITVILIIVGILLSAAGSSMFFNFLNW